MFSAETFRKLWPHARQALIDAVVTQGPTLFPKYGLNESLTIAHAMAQFSHECGADTEGVENLNYSAQGLINTWPKHFNSGNAMQYAHNPQKIANYVYEPPIHNDLGNNPNSEDGWNYRGRGGSQTTGRDGYAKVAAKTGIDVMSNPDLMNDPQNWLECALADFVICGCLPFAQKDDVTSVTHHLNGGLIGLDQRKEWLAKWKAALAAEGMAPVSPPRDTNAAKIGDSGPHVAETQKQLADKGYMPGKVDGDFGPSTRAAVTRFQVDNNLPATGEIDAATRAALPNAPAAPVAESRATATADDLRKAGSETIKNADNVTAVGKAVVAVGGGAATIEQTDVLDTVHHVTDQFNAVRSAVEGVQDILHWALSHWYFAASLAGFSLWYFGKQIIARRVADHQSGANMGR